MSEETEAVNQMLAESRKKTTQIATAGVIGVVVLGFGIWGAVKFYPISSELTRLIDTVEELEKNAGTYSPLVSDVTQMRSELERITLSLEALKVRVTNDEAVDSQLRLTTFPETVRAVELRLAKLDDVTGDAAGDLERLRVEVEKNTQDHVKQQDRAGERAGFRLVRDGKIAANTEDNARTAGRVDEIEGILEGLNSVALLQAEIQHLKTDVETITEWRNTLQVSNVEILEGQIKAMRVQIDALEEKLGSRSGL